MDKESINTDIDTEAPAAEKATAANVFSRRGFVQRSGKALYLVPTLTLLGSALASAQGTEPCDPDTDPGCDSLLSGSLAAPEAPAPTE